MNTLEFIKRNSFSVISWFITLLIVAGIVAAGLWYQGSTAANALVPEPTAQPEENPPEVAQPVIESGGGSGNGFSAISRSIQLKTNMPERPRYNVDKYTVARGDSAAASTAP